MSLDVYLREKIIREPGHTGVFVREKYARDDDDGRELTEAEVDSLRAALHVPTNADLGDIEIRVEPDYGCEFSANITHNLGAMADEAGIYKHLWRPEEIGVTHARQLIEPLRAGLALMRSDPARFRHFDAKNGWGTYEQFLPWIADYLAACEANPDSEIRVSR